MLDVSVSVYDTDAAAHIRTGLMRINSEINPNLVIPLYQAMKQWYRRFSNNSHYTMLRRLAVLVIWHQKVNMRCGKSR